MNTKPQSYYRYFPVSDRDIKWGLHVTTAGETSIPPNTPYPPGGHPKEYAFDWTQGRVLNVFSIVYISGGRGWFESEPTGKQKIESGNVFIVFPGIWHRYMPTPENGWTEYWISFDGDIPRQRAKQGFFRPENAILKLRHEDRILDIFTGVMNAIKNNEPALQQVMAGATEHMLSLLYSANHATSSDERNVVSAIHEAIHLMNQQPGTDIDLKDLAQKLNVSYTWFRRSFLQHTGLSPHQYLLQLRIARARSLLSETTRTVQQAAFQLGFENEQYFCRLFKKKTGLTPSEWRAHSRRKDQP